MRVFLLAVLCVAAVSAVAASDVTVLTPDNFFAETGSGQWLVKFYAPWCGHCKKLAPTYEKVATALKGQVNVGKVDCDAHRQVGSAFGVRGFPTLKVIADGQVYDHSGGRGESDLVDFATEGYKSVDSKPAPTEFAAPAPAPAPKKELPKHTGPSDVVVLDPANFWDNVNDGSTWLLEFYAPWCGHCKRLAPTYEHVATNLKGEVKVGKIDAAEHRSLGTPFGVKGFPTLKLVADGKVYDYSGDRSLDHLIEFSKTGYKKADAKDLPAAPTGATNQFETFKQKATTQWMKFFKFIATEHPELKPTMMDLNNLLRYEKNAAAIVFTMGAIFGCIVTQLFCCCCCRSRAAKIKKD